MKMNTRMNNTVAGAVIVALVVAIFFVFLSTHMVLDYNPHAARAYKSGLVGGSSMTSTEIESAKCEDIFKAKDCAACHSF